MLGVMPPMATQGTVVNRLQLLRICGDGCPCEALVAVG